MRTRSVTDGSRDCATDVRLLRSRPEGPVDHVVYVSYAERAEREFLGEAVGVPLGEVNAVVRSLDVEDERSIESDREVTVALEVTSVGETSVTIAYWQSADGRLVATAKTVSVLLEETGTPRAIPDRWRRRIEAYDRGESA